MVVGRHGQPNPLTRCGTLLKGVGVFLNRMLVGLYCLFSFLGSWAQTPQQWTNSPAWDWFGYDWIAEYGGNLFDDAGETVGRVFWIDYNEIVAISQMVVPGTNIHYNRLKGFGLGNERNGRLYRDDTPADAIPMRWTFIPNGVTAYIEFRYIDLSLNSRKIWGILVRRW